MKQSSSGLPLRPSLLVPDLVTSIYRSKYFYSLPQWTLHIASNLFSLHATSKSVLCFLTVRFPIPQFAPFEKVCLCWRVVLSEDKFDALQ
jgi:hypothetical protein